jgi:hypothetical protein
VKEGILNCIFTIILVLLLGIAPLTVLILVSDEGAAEGGTFGGGDGSAANPYVIKDVFDLQNMNSNLSANYVLANDINAVATKNWNNGSGFQPVGNQSIKFNGSLDGNGHEIIGLFIDRPSDDEISLFGILDKGSVIKNVGLTGTSSKIRGRWAVGGLAGWNQGTITNCYSTINLDGMEAVGGLVGFNHESIISNSYSSGTVNLAGTYDVGGFVGLTAGGTIENCYATGDVIANGVFGVGGFVGLNDEAGSIANCYATGNVFGEREVGGFAGANDAGPISNSYSTGIVNGTDYNIGGFIGKNYGAGKITNCYSTGSANGNSQTGGFIGYNSDGTITNCFTSGNTTGNNSVEGGFVGRNNAVITNCYATGNTSGNMGFIGGFVGYNDAGSITNSYATGSASGPSEIGGFVGRNDVSIINCYSTGTVSGSSFTGGFVGRNFGGISIADCFWDNITSGMTTSPAGTGKNTTEMKQQGTFTNWNFTSPWSIIENSTYPYLITLKPIIMSQNLIFLSTAREDNLYVSSFEFRLPIHPAGNKAGNWKMSTSTTGWLSFNDTTAVLSGTPTNADVGTWYVNVSLNDSNGAEGNLNFTLTVENTPPEITGSDITTATATVLYTNDYDSTDDGQGTVIWGLNTDASWLEINPATGTISGTPPNNQPGTHIVTVTVSDGNGGTGQRTFTITVADINDDPVITTLPPDTASEYVQYSVLLEATDADPVTTSFTWVLDTNASWLELDGNYLHGTPGSSDAGNTFYVIINVSDNQGGFDELNYNISVANTNDQPLITTLPILTAIEDEEYNLSLAADDPDPEDILTWSLDSGHDWLGLNTTTWTILGTPENDDVGHSTVNISVSDGKGGSAWKEFTLVVENTNDDPVITADPPRDINEDAVYSVKLTATDEDPVATTFRWSLETDANWLSLDGNHLYGTPANSDVGSYEVNVTVSDGMGGSDYLLYTLNVTNTNDAPEWKKVPSYQILTEGGTLLLDSEAADMDGDTISYSIESTPDSNISIDASSGKIEWVSPAVGNYTVTITATDGTDPIEHTFAVIVNAIPTAPDPDPDPDKNVTTDDTDSDGDGMPNWWEDFYGFDPENPADAQSDPDNDDKTNLQEYMDRTSPLKDDSDKDDVVDDDKKGDEKDSEALGLESPAVSIPLGLIIGVIIGIVVGMMMRAKKKSEGEPEGSEEEEAVKEEEELEEE